MRKLDIAPQDLFDALLDLDTSRKLCLLDCGGLSLLDSHLLIAGIDPVETFSITNDDSNLTLSFLDEKLSDPKFASIFTISYDFGLKLNRVVSTKNNFLFNQEPDVFLARFDMLVIYNYRLQCAYLKGNSKKFAKTEKLLRDILLKKSKKNVASDYPVEIKSNFTKAEYIARVNLVKEEILKGNTYQTNFTQQFTATSEKPLNLEAIFRFLRAHHPTAFAAFVRRENDTVVSASPERFLKIYKSAENSPPAKTRKISVSPIKGTRPRGQNAAEDKLLRNELLMSEKDRAENIMIVDLLRNDIGRICEYGSVKVEKLCDLEALSTVFHLVSTVSGTLRNDTKFSDILRAVFPCGSITGAPKISTMRIIDALETKPRGLSMGAIGYQDFDASIDMSVAIRTMVAAQNTSVFNVGGGITIDSQPEDEYDESITKARALIAALKHAGKS